MRKWFNNKLLYIIGALVGAVAGYLYWQKIGCSSGSCSITSRPLNSTLYGAVFGTLLFGMFKNGTKKQEKNQNNDISSNDTIG